MQATGKRGKKVQDQQDSEALCPPFPWRDSLMTIVPLRSLCLKGSINLRLPTLFSHPFPWNKGISRLWNLYCCWQTQLRLVMCNSYYREQNWQSNMKNLIFSVHVFIKTGLRKHNKWQQVYVTNTRWQSHFDRWTTDEVMTEGRGNEMDEKLKLGKKRLIIKIWNFSLINLNCISRFEVFYLLSHLVWG